MRNKLKFLSAVFSAGVRLGWLTENPIIAGGLSGRVSKAARRFADERNIRRDYTTEEIQRVFSSPIFTSAGWAPPRAKFGEAWQWLPLLMYYTGARREELAQLKAREVIVEPGQPPHLDILTTMESGETRGVKNAGSRRVIPLHPDLIERGFLWSPLRPRRSSFVTTSTSPLSSLFSSCRKPGRSDAGTLPDTVSAMAR